MLRGDDTEGGTPSGGPRKPASPPSSSESRRLTRKLSGAAMSR